ncbi:hypothetical protein E3N88_28448 [Mikania micrantha]|uniref:Uncharacterized protein n=1 Tax=Mikania micrantha TaxID=192012 RepID=A0A5N6N0N7_9ASTR|nr:hypothetical protein E3N88_28448 [Mikania micrantha]
MPPRLQIPRRQIPRHPRGQRLAQLIAQQMAAALPNLVTQLNAAAHNGHDENAFNSTKWYLKQPSQDQCADLYPLTCAAVLTYLRMPPRLQIPRRQIPRHPRGQRLAQLIAQQMAAALPNLVTQLNAAAHNGHDENGVYMVEDFKAVDVEKVEGLLDHAEKQDGNSKKKKMINMIFLATIWRIWQARNEKVFSRKNTGGLKILEDVKELSYLWLHNRSKFTLAY